MKETTNGKLKIRKYTIICRELKNGQYAIRVPAIPEICTYAKGKSAIGREARDAITCALESMKAREEKIPEEKPVIVKKVQVKC